MYSLGLILAVVLLACGSDRTPSTAAPVAISPAPAATQRHDEQRACRAPDLFRLAYRFDATGAHVREVHRAADAPEHVPSLLGFHPIVFP